MKRQESLPTSSSHREIPKENMKNLHAKSIGCMAGIIHFVSGNRGRRKFLTFGKKQEKINEVASPKNPNSSPEVKEEGKKEGKNSTATHFRRLSSSDVPRSPTLPAEIRRSNSVNSSENFRTPPALVARLMGLEEAPMSKSQSPAEIRTESAAEKRLKLLGALEKCDKDLKALKKIIDAVRSAERLRSSAITFKSPEGEESRKRCSGGMWSESNNTEQPSPVSVLDELSGSRGTPSPLRNSHFKPPLYYNNGGGLLQHHNQRQHQIIRKKPGEEEEFINPSIIFDRITSETAAQTWKNIKAAANVHEHDHDENGITRAAASPPWSSKAMRDSVEEVCRDVAWGERREIGRIGLGLHDHICRDLIEEIVIDMTPPPYHQHHHLNDHQHMSSYHDSQRLLPFEACKRRLCF